MTKHKRKNKVTVKQITDEQGRACTEATGIVKRDRRRKGLQSQHLGGCVSTLIVEQVAPIVKKADHNENAVYGVHLCTDEICMDMARHGTGDISFRARVYPGETELVFRTPAPKKELDLSVEVAKYEKRRAMSAEEMLAQLEADAEARVKTRAGGGSAGWGGFGLGICSGYAREPWQENLTFRNIDVGGVNHQEFRIVIPCDLIPH